MPRRGRESALRVGQRQAALSRWDNEGGAGPGGKPQEAAGSHGPATDAEDRYTSAGFPDADAAEPAPTAAAEPRQPAAG